MLKHVAADSKLRWQVIAGWSFLFFWAVLFCFWQWQLYTPGIFGDMWDNLKPTQQMLGWRGAEWAEELFRRYAQSHVLLIPKLIFFIDFDFFGASGALTRWCSVLVSFFCAGAAYYCALASRFSISKIMAAVLAVLIFLSPLQIFVVNWHVLLQHCLSVFFALCCCLALAKKRYLMAVMLAVGAALSSGAGVAVLGLSLGVLCIAGIRQRSFTLEQIVALLLVLTALWLVRPGSQLFVTALFGVENFFSLLLQLFAFPLSGFYDARWFGVLLLVFCMVSGWRCLWSRADSLDFVTVFAGLLLLSVAWGRYHYMSWDADLSRYYIFCAPLLFAVVCRIANFRARVLPIFVLCLVAVNFIAGLPLLAVTNSISQKTALANAVYFNGNNQHYARIKLDALSQDDLLTHEREYLQREQLDVFYRVLQVPVSVQEASRSASFPSCRLQLLERRHATKKQFVDYWWQQTSGSKLQQVIAIDEIGKTHFMGVAVANNLPLAGWFLEPRQFSWGEHAGLLIPVAWLPVAEKRWLIHLPALEKLENYQWYGRDNDGQWCKLNFSYRQ